MSGYLQRLASSAIKPGAAIQPLAGSVFAPPEPAAEAAPLPLENMEAVVPERQEAREQPLVQREEKFAPPPEPAAPAPRLFSQVEPVDRPRTVESPGAEETAGTAEAPGIVERASAVEKPGAVDKTVSVNRTNVAKSTHAAGKADVVHEVALPGPPPELFSPIKSTTETVAAKTLRPGPDAQPPQASEAPQNLLIKTEATTGEKIHLEPTRPPEVLVAPRIEQNPKQQLPAKSAPPPIQSLKPLFPAQGRQGSRDVAVENQRTTAASENPPKVLSIQERTSRQIEPTPPRTALVPVSPRVPAPIPKSAFPKPVAAAKVAAARSEPDDIQIHIGRIEVAATPPARHAPVKTRRGATSLSEYLRQRDGRAA